MLAIGVGDVPAIVGGSMLLTRSAMIKRYLSIICRTMLGERQSG
jgi:hypothetical protein